jgi:hypothetical protein
MGAGLTTGGRLLVMVRKFFAFTLSCRASGMGVFSKS